MNRIRRPSLRWARLLCVIMWGAVASQAVAADYVLIDFTASWCGPCRQMEPVMKQLVDQGWIVRQIDVDREPHHAGRWKVERLPTLIVLADGEEVDRIVGAADAAELTAHLARLTGRGVASQPATSSTATSPSAISPFTSQDPAAEANLSAAAASEPPPFAIAGPASNAAPTANATDDGFRSGSTAFPALASHHATPTSHISPAPAQAFDSSAAVVDPMAASVRLRVDEGRTLAFGTGTIVDQQDDQVLVLTCGHLFRDGAGRSPLTVEYFSGGRLVPTAGEVLHYEFEDADLALVRFRCSEALAVAPLRPAAEPLAEGETVCSIGCDHGADPSRHDSRITKLNRYLGSPNVEVAGAPVQGRSGGGLFDGRGRLIGICYAADGELDEGLYGSAALLHERLPQLGLAKLCQTPVAIAAAQAPETFPAAAMPVAATPAVAASQPPAFAMSDAFAQPTQAAASASNTSEPPVSLTVIVRGASGEQIIDVPAASPELVQQLRTASAGSNVRLSSR